MQITWNLLKQSLIHCVGTKAKSSGLIYTHKGYFFMSLGTMLVLMFSQQGLMTLWVTDVQPQIQFSQYS